MEYFYIVVQLWYIIYKVSVLLQQLYDRGLKSTTVNIFKVRLLKMDSAGYN